MAGPEKQSVHSALVDAVIALGVVVMALTRTVSGDLALFALLSLAGVRGVASAKKPPGAPPVSAVMIGLGALPTIAEFLKSRAASLAVIVMAACSRS